MKQKCERDLQLAVPTPEVTLMECYRLQAALDKEIEEHSKTKADLSSVHGALAAANLSRADSDKAKNAGTGTLMQQKRELVALREKNIDQAEQIQVSKRLQCVTANSNRYAYLDLVAFICHF